VQAHGILPAHRVEDARHLAARAEEILAVDFKPGHARTLGQHLPEMRRAQTDPGLRRTGLA